MLNDPRFVKYMVRIYGIKDGVEYEKMIPYHKCTEEDWAQFPPASIGSYDAIEQIKKNPDRGMYCIDWTEDIEIYGNENNSNYQRIEIVFLPCNYLHTTGFRSSNRESADLIYPGCFADKEK